MISGSLENVVFYRRMGKSCVRIKRESIKQTDATKKRSANFGIAARAGRGLRAGLQQVMPLPTDRRDKAGYPAPSPNGSASLKWIVCKPMMMYRILAGLLLPKARDFTAGVK